MFLHEIVFYFYYMQMVKPVLEELKNILTKNLFLERFSFRAMIFALGYVLLEVKLMIYPG